ncbi:hypothetical protein HELRODRAFT_191815 [Helobdella robusta]|uniref:Negative elongation factor E n=1 Tax=Helobdella robusta TaxID=6412 RepID=T1FTC2_HELRO|nr:hypothetical protein HELRODRAFT_191815 [Helobdella robusta]ESO03970.1 hypothetical protein HELRODRAFT_191815 [Helobdella robusta]
MCASYVLIPETPTTRKTLRHLRTDSHALETTSRERYFVLSQHSNQAILTSQQHTIEQEAPAAPEPKKFKSGVRRGSTVHVFASGMNEMFIQKTFACAGNLVHISHDANKNTAFVTFENVACAEEAINQLNEKTVEGITLKVSMARKQPNFDSNAEPPADWSAIAASSSQKGSHKDCRSLVTYGDEMF